MSEKRYVQYKNDPNGTKWEAMYDDPNNKHISISDGERLYHVPRQDYIPCQPPERWIDVTAECRAYIWTWDGKADNTAYYLSHEGAMVQQNAGYRLRKVQLYLSRPDSDNNCTRWAFIVEKRED